MQKLSAILLFGVVLCVFVQAFPRPFVGDFDGDFDKDFDDFMGNFESRMRELKTRLNTLFKHLNETRNDVVIGDRNVMSTDLHSETTSETKEKNGLVTTTNVTYWTDDKGNKVAVRYVSVTRSKDSEGRVEEEEEEKNEIPNKGTEVDDMNKP